MKKTLLPTLSIEQAKPNVGLYSIVFAPCFLFQRSFKNFLRARYSRRLTTLWRTYKLKVAYWENDVRIKLSFYLPELTRVPLFGCLIIIKSFAGSRDNRHLSCRTVSLANASTYYMPLVHSALDKGQWREKIFLESFGRFHCVNTRFK